MDQGELYTGKAPMKPGLCITCILRSHSGLDILEFFSLVEDRHSEVAK